MLKLFVFACLVAMAFASTYIAPVAAPLPYLYSGAYPYAHYETRRIEFSDYKSPLSYTAKYTPPTVYSATPGVYAYGYPYYY